MRIYLDFDGVLRRESSPKSSLDADLVQHFERAVLTYPEARVVIVSTWRLVHKLDALRKLFSGAFAPRVEGVTPDLPEAEEYARQAEINAYMNRNKLHGVRWIAVDDDPENYRPGTPLIRIDPALGFNEDCALRLRSWIAGK